MTSSEIVMAVYSLCVGFWIGVLCERRAQQNANGNAADIGRWLSGAVLSVRDTHRFAGKVECRNVGKLTTKHGETFVVTVEKEGAP